MAGGERLGDPGVHPKRAWPRPPRQTASAAQITSAAPLPCLRAQPDQFVGLLERLLVIPPIRIDELVELAERRTVQQFAKPIVLILRRGKGSRAAARAALALAYLSAFSASVNLRSSSSTALSTFRRRLRTASPGVITS